MDGRKNWRRKMAAKSRGRDNRQKKHGQKPRQTVPFRACPAETAPVKT
jgi:hypothetical protein